ncbi:flagellar motor switch protein FliM [Microbacterium stercoris]|uniref:Flagellar motor switch protein FliM n=1 Tax=Microbacterium stercoris TaxID=2820289 RepID=A0A939QKH0_9MICO|nr:flagellar motor switch protein FliM [Microbacterium stercoris]MBO3664593.1 flagellar motor switch protein FliM [Microbacterium stercoris]
MRIEERAPGHAPAEAERRIEVYDFGRPATLAREHARALELGFETFARQWATQLTDKVRVRAHVGLEQVSLTTYGDYAGSLPSTTTIVACGVPDSEPNTIVQLPLSAALSWIIQMVGGRAVDVVDERALTPIEQALIRHLVTDALEGLSTALGGLLPRGLAVAGIQYSPQFAQLASAGDPVIIARFSLRLGERTVPASIMLPAGPVIDRLSSATPAAPVENAPALIRRQVEETAVELAVRLTPHRVHPADILGLSVGDVLRLPHAADRPLDLVAGDVPVATAAVGTSGARLACVVTAITASHDHAAHSEELR